MRSPGRKGTVFLLLLSCSLLGCGISDRWKEKEEGKKEAYSPVKVHYTMPVAGEASVISEQTMETKVSGKNLRIATIGSPYREILEEAGKLLEKKGYDLQIQIYEDYNAPNESVASGEADGNFFQHSSYLERYNLEKETALTEAAMVYFQPMAIYKGRADSLKEKKENMKIFVPMSVTGYARALFLLQQEGILTLAEDTDLMAVEGDIVENPYNIILVQLEEEEIWEKRQEADFIICSTAYALGAGRHPKKEALAMEKADSLAAASFGQGLVTLEENKEKLQPLAEVLCSKEMQEFITYHYQGSLQFQGEILKIEEELE